MLLGVNSSLENSIVTSLTAAGGLTATEILDSVKSRGNKASIQGVYKVLTKLHDEGIINKQSTRYNLRLPWILDLAELVEHMQEVYFKKDYFSQIIPTSSSEKKCWHFTSLFKLINFWIDIQLALIESTKVNITYSCIPHTWYGLTHIKQWSHFQELLKKRLNFQFTIVGGKSYLDQYLNAILKDGAPQETHLFTKDAYPQKSRKLYTTVIGDYIVTIKLSKKTSQQIDRLFSNITSEDDMHLLEVMDTFTESVRSSIQIKKDTVGAKKYRNKFRRIFGPVRLYVGEGVKEVKKTPTHPTKQAGV